MFFIVQDLVILRVFLPHRLRIVLLHFVLIHFVLIHSVKPSLGDLLFSGRW